MAVDLPKSVRHLIIGAGIHGLSTAWHLARELKSRGRGSADDVLVVDKTGVAAGASGIACGIIRNNYLQPAMGAVMLSSVEIWDAHADALHYKPVGYLCVAGELQANDLEATAARHQQMDYAAAFVRGEQETFDYMRQLFPDWKARGLTVCLHEHRGGFGFNKESIHGLADLAEAEGVRIQSGVTVTGFDLNGTDGSVTTVNTDRGTIDVGQVVIAVGPWIKQLWSLLELPDKVDVRGRGQVNQDLQMWTYWQLQEGEITVDPQSYKTATGRTPPVMHVDSTEPLISDRTGKQITDELWGIYFKQDREGVQGGSVPIHLGTAAQVDPYGPESLLYTVDNQFADYWSAGLAHCLERFEGKSRLYKNVPTGGIGCFTVDSFPVCDFMRPNVYVIADSNHGYKMISIGKEVARVLQGEHSDILHPFRFSRFDEGDLHPVSNGPFPWQ